MSLLVYRILRWLLHFCKIVGAWTEVIRNPCSCYTRLKNTVNVRCRHRQLKMLCPILLYIFCHVCRTFWWTELGIQYVCDMYSTWPMLSLCDFIILGPFCPHSSSFSGGERSSVLQEVSVTIFNNSDCRRAYSSSLVPRRNYPEGIINSQLCAGDPNGGKDACQVWGYYCISAEINVSSIKCKISLVHAMKAYRSNRGVAPLILNLSIRWR